MKQYQFQLNFNYAKVKVNRVACDTGVAVILNKNKFKHYAWQGFLSMGQVKHYLETDKGFCACFFASGSYREENGFRWTHLSSGEYLVGYIEGRKVWGVMSGGEPFIWSERCDLPALSPFAEAKRESNVVTLTTQLLHFAKSPDN